MKHNILEFISKRYKNQRLAENLEWALTECQIPVPDDDQYFKAFDNGILVFRNVYGSVVRIVDHLKNPIYDHPHLLRPLGALAIGKLRLEINPGGRCPVSQEDAIRVHKNVAKSGLAHPFATRYSGSEHQPDLHKPHNNIYLPITTENFPDGFPVLIDFGHIVDLTKSANCISKMLDQNVIDLCSSRKPDIQDECYGELRSMFLNA